MTTADGSQTGRHEKTGSRDKAGDQSRRIDPIAGLFFAAIALTPLYIGGHHPAIWGLHALIFGLLLLVYELRLLATGAPHPVSLARLWLPALLMGLVIAGIVIQVLPLGAHPLWSLAAEQLGLPLATSFAINRDLALEGLLRLLTACAVFWLAANICRDPRRSEQLVKTVAAAGAVYALYGIIQFFLFPNRLLFQPKLFYLESLTSVFVNRNSYALYAAIGLICALVTVIRIYQRAASERQARLRYLEVLQASFGMGGLWICAAIVTLLAMILTGSRAGVFCGFMGLAAVALIFIARGRRPVVAMVLAAGLFVGGAVFLLAFGQLLGERLISVQGDAEARWSVYRMVLRMIGDAPWLGSGMSSFPDAFPPYRDTSIPPLRIWELAHNTYLELAQGLGLPLFAAWIVALLAVLLSCIKGAVQRRRSFSACVVAVAATVAIGFHSLVDFSAQMQAVALTWTALLGAGFARGTSSRVNLSDGARQHRSDRAPAGRPVSRRETVED